MTHLFLIKKLIYILRMGFLPNMISSTKGVQLSAPLSFRTLPGVVADVWQVTVSRGASGSYVAPDPRIVAVLGRDDSLLRLGHGGSGRRAAVPVRLAFVPAGVPAWSSFPKAGPLQHLDIHFKQVALERRLADFSPDPTRKLTRVCLSPDAQVALRIAERLAEEIRASAYSGSALDQLISELLEVTFSEATDLGEPESALVHRAASGGLTPSQLAQIDELMRDQMFRSVGVAEMAECVGLSPSWFAHAYCNSRGEPPHRALQRMRIEHACHLLRTTELSLAAVAADVGFADQAHFSRSFRKMAGTSPGVWRRGSRDEPLRVEANSRQF